VAEILEGVTGDEARVEALNRWVAHRVRYRGFSLGPQEGYTMHPGTLVLENRAGVCKDKAGMLVTLLRAAGYEAYPAMTMAGSRVERIAADQFNHAVVAWRQADGTFRLVDPTWAPFSQDLWSRAETEQHYLVGTPEGEDLAITPAEGPERNGLAMTAETRLAADGTITGTVRIEPAGYLDDRIRRLFGRSSALETRALVEEIAMRLAPAAEVISHRMLDPFSLDDPFFLEFAYRAERHAAADGDLIRLRPPATRHPFGAGRLADYLSAVAGPDRTTPVMLRSAQRLTARERIALPERFDLVAPVDERVETSLGGFTGRIAQEGRTLIVEWTTEIRKRMLTVGDYGALRDLVAAAGAFAERSVLLRRGAAGRGGAR
jgi:hypothetical protein